MARKVQFYANNFKIGTNCSIREPIFNMSRRIQIAAKTEPFFPVTQIKLSPFSKVNPLKIRILLKHKQIS